MSQKLQPTVVRFEMFELDLRALELRKSGHKIHLPLQPARLLALLVTHPGELVTRDEIEKQLWPDHIVDFEHAINDAIKNLLFSSEKIRERYNELKQQLIESKITSYKAASELMKLFSN